MYIWEDYTKALEKRDECEIFTTEWDLCQSKVRAITTAMVAAGDNQMVREIVDELYSLSDSGCELEDEAVQFDIWVLESNGFKSEADEAKNWFE